MARVCSKRRRNHFCVREVTDFLARLCCAPLPAAPGSSCPSPLYAVLTQACATGRRSRSRNRRSSATVDRAGGSMREQKRRVSLFVRSVYICVPARAPDADCALIFNWFVRAAAPPHDLRGGWLQRLLPWKGRRFTCIIAGARTSAVSAFISS